MDDEGTVKGLSFTVGKVKISTKNLESINQVINLDIEGKRITDCSECNISDVKAMESSSPELARSRSEIGEDDGEDANDDMDISQKPLGNNIEDVDLG
ncbi:hypothetical protein F0562_032483 [Nyssa sinensis]|uniref:Uncharacterized protein n=1 Tax=Nyssa sinensis TaxID=561372 RepID=A0A5J5AP61_9ASTE|nr:hypothetical protein F0562_032483 [Nyssa sinensis]